jgi:hypothetical protein
MISAQDDLSDRSGMEMMGLDMIRKSMPSGWILGIMLKQKIALAHVPAKWLRFADKDMRQHENLQRFPVILDHSVIHGSLGDPI